MRVPVAATSAFATLFLATEASPNLHRREPYRTAFWGAPQPTYIPSKDLHTETPPAQPSYSPESQERPTERHHDFPSSLGGWKNGWTRPISNEKWEHDYQQYDHDEDEAQDEEYEVHDEYKLHDEDYEVHDDEDEVQDEYEVNDEEYEVDDEEYGVHDEEHQDSAAAMSDYEEDEEYQDNAAAPSAYEEDESYERPIPTQRRKQQNDIQPKPSQEEQIEDIESSTPHHHHPTPTSQTTSKSYTSPPSTSTSISTPTPAFPSHQFQTSLSTTTAQEIYAAPTTIHETRTVTYSYQEAGHKKFAVTTMVGDWTIAQPGLAVSTVWITKWMEHPTPSASSSSLVVAAPAVMSTKTGVTIPQSHDTPSSSSALSSSAPPTISPLNGKQLLPPPLTNSSIPNPHTNPNASTNGRCGILANKWTCSNTPFGPCCSQFGWCGSSDLHCGNGCQAGFGACDPAAKPVRMPSLGVSVRSSTTAGMTAEGGESSTPLVVRPTGAVGDGGDVSELLVVRPTSTVVESAPFVGGKTRGGKKVESGDMVVPTGVRRKGKTLKEILGGYMRPHA